MKRLFSTAFFFVFALVAVAQEGITLCHTPSTQKFALFASNRNFNLEHPAPRTYTHVSLAGGEMIKFKCADGTEANGYVLKARKKTNNWIFGSLGMVFAFNTKLKIKLQTNAV